MTRCLLAGGASAILMGLALVVPAFVGRLEQGSYSELAVVVLSFAAVLVLGGLAAVLAASRGFPQGSIPAPVRAVILANMLFLAFCALEASDGLVRQQGRIFYWTTVLFLPALALLWGVVFARPWAWRAARGSAAFFVLWFAGFLLLIPFADLKRDGVPVPWHGRAYMIGVSLIFASIAGYVFRALGDLETKAYFRHPDPM